MATAQAPKIIEHIKLCLAMAPLGGSGVDAGVGASADVSGVFTSSSAFSGAGATSVRTEGPGVGIMVGTGSPLTNPGLGASVLPDIGSDTSKPPYVGASVSDKVGGRVVSKSKVKLPLFFPCQPKLLLLPKAYTNLFSPFDIILCSPGSSRYFANSIIVFPSSCLMLVYINVWCSEGTSDVRGDIPCSVYFKTVPGSSSASSGFPIMACPPFIVPSGEMPKPMKPSVSLSRRAQSKLRLSDIGERMMAYLNVMALPSSVLRTVDSVSSSGQSSAIAPLRRKRIEAADKTFIAVLGGNGKAVVVKK
mmetsp:Transcript_31355/g.66752  ORF Transcript_31355/g.66752 Transcript_31355/m.66752 type:complete len:305 (-) Transcript_31355:21-935(-)